MKRRCRGLSVEVIVAFVRDDCHLPTWLTLLLSLGSGFVVGFGCHSERNIGFVILDESSKVMKLIQAVAISNVPVEE